MIKTGYVVGTGASIDITLGFIPNHVTLLNTEGLARLDWTSDMPAAAGVKQITAGTMTYITTLGISPLGSTSGLTVSADNTLTDNNTITMTNPKGFRIGADTDMNVSGEDIYWVATGLGGDSDN